MCCLVRGRSAGDAWRRLVETCRQLRIPADDLPDRVEVVPGRLDERRFGLDPAAYTDLAGDPGTRRPGRPAGRVLAEQMGRRRQAAERGLDTATYRLGLVGGPSVTGAGNPRDILTRLFRAIAATGAAPRYSQPLSIAPVDHVASAIVALSGRPDSVGGTFHLFNRRAVNLLDLIDGLPDSEFGIRIEEPYAWADRLRRQAADPDLAALADLVRDAAPDPNGARHAGAFELGFDDRRTAAGLTASGIRPPHVDAGYGLRCLTHLIRAPRARPSHDPW